ncbi:uncharacterized protein ACWYII_032571 [Salvelinus alpinus]
MLAAMIEFKLTEVVMRVRPKRKSSLKPTLRPPLTRLMRILSPRGQTSEFGPKQHSMVFAATRQVTAPVTLLCRVSVGTDVTTSTSLACHFIQEFVFIGTLKHP